MYKKKIVALFIVPLLFTGYFLTYNHEIPSILTFNTGKKKIVIFTSSGGGGHVSASNALQEYLSDTYEVKVSYIFEEVLGSMDPMQRITFGKQTGEDAYNECMRKKWYRMINIISRFGHWYFSVFHKRATKLICNYLELQQPDLVISVVPVINNAILSATKKMNIPFLLIPTDLDATTFVNSIYKPNYEKFHVGIAFDNENIFKRMEQSGIPKEQISTIGFPIAKKFFTPKNMRRIKADFQIPQNKPIVFLLMGAQGTNALYTYVKYLTQVEQPFHLVAAIGKNEDMRKKLEAIALPTHITMTIVGFTDRVADLMAIADLGIIKSGTVTYIEALYSNLPVLLDATTGTIRWEQYNHIYNKEQEFGDSIGRNREIYVLVNELLSNPKTLAQIRKNIQTNKKKCLGREIKSLVHELVN